MLTQRRRILRAVIVVLFLVGSSLVALSLEQDAQDTLPTDTADDSVTKPAMTLKYGRQKLKLDVASDSTEHEEAILQIVREQFDGVAARVDFHTSQLMEPGWSTTSARLLQLVGTTNSAEVSIVDDTLRIHGTSNDAAAVQKQLSLLRDVLPDGMALDANILNTTSAKNSAELCARSFEPIAAATIHFRQTSTRIRESSFPLLDRLVEFAYDCRDAKIAVVGHTDSTGEESWNIQVSLARAQAVADYVTSRGISSDRLLLEGVGSARPLGDNNTVAGRERNRRIELELR